MRILAVDTSTPWGSVALREGTKTRGEVRLQGGEGHSRWLLPAIDSLLGGLGLAASDVEAYAVATGPGSFTGLRVGISTIQGLALASPRPCLGLSTLDALAALVTEGVDPRLAMMDAGRGEVYAALYEASGPLRGERRVGAVEAFLDEIKGEVIFVGDGAELHRAQIQAALPGARFAPGPWFVAAALGRLAEPRLAAGEGQGPEALRPLYLRQAQIRKASP
ncbi:MAG TPA: tRNA (adenosine(37)-N6)-threonylcarbamoyltransferase complex dimerization subunit type 1 TsaB [Vicinamibacteria bacterium]|nr:tRNA (adenosine(37)-N6)-threonylcarbamoyltransferase complex dimerization subunit type 1 TsaB [Vicinamibacteria bacterium]